MPTSAKSTPAAPPPEADAQSSTSRAKGFFAEHLRLLMQQRGWNQSELARRADLGRDVISAYTTEKSLPTRANLERLAAAFGVAVSELLPPMHVQGEVNPPLRALALGNGLIRVQLDAVMSTADFAELAGPIERAVWGGSRSTR